MSSRPFILATAGHVDHGKSALVLALTGTDPDRLPEEKARGITIDLGFAHFDLPAPDGGAPFSVGVVDVPGHEDFVKNMVAGVGSIDVALFVVAADDGWMPQSEEHLQILAYLGITRAVVALTKVDLVAGCEPQAVADVRARLERSPFADAPIVPTSIPANRGLGELKAALAGVLATAPPPPDIGKPRLPVDRVFSLKGVGTVVTGTLSGGRFVRGQPVVLQPGDRATRIRSLQSHSREVEVCGPGMRTAVNLPDVEVVASGQAILVARGDVLTLPELGGATETIDVQLERSARPGSSQAPALRPLKDRTRVRVHAGSGNTPATVFLNGATELAAGHSCLAQLRFESPAFLLAGDRFILRDWAEQHTLGGGVVLDADGDRKHWQHKAQRALLAARAAALDDAGAWLAAELARDGVTRRSEVLRRSRFSAGQVADAIARLGALERAVAAGEFLADPGRWQEWLARAAEAVDQAHRLHPEWTGLPLAELRGRFAEELALPGTFDAFLAALLRDGFAQAGTAVRRAAHRPTLPPRLQAVGDWLRQALREKPFEPPSRKELMVDALSQQALKFLLEAGEAVEIGPEQLLSAEAYAEAVDRIRRRLRESGPATVSDLRQVVGATRRIVVPLLEKLDREGLTRRQGDLRTLGPAPG